MFGNSNNNTNNSDNTNTSNTNSTNNTNTNGINNTPDSVATATTSTASTASIAPTTAPTIDTTAATRTNGVSPDRKRKSSRASQFIASARHSFSDDVAAIRERMRLAPPPEDPPAVPTRIVGNSAGESKPGPKSTFRVGVTEDKNRKCRRTMEDTHSYLYNFLPGTSPSNPSSASVTPDGESKESDNGYFAIFDGHAGTYAADWCGKKLHVVLADMVRKFPDHGMPELLDMTFTNCDSQLERLPVKNSGCTAVCAVLRWEERLVPDVVTNGAHKTNNISPAGTPTTTANNENSKPNAPQNKQIQRILYTANVGDARIVLCRNGKALRLSYDHKGSDENEGKRVANAGGLILNNRVNGVLAVTRALGDSYMKDLVTGHPYTTETIISSEADDFIILACDGLWDVCSDQEAVDLVRNVADPQKASKILVDYALSRFSSDNLSCMIVRLDLSGNFESLNAEKKKLEREAELKICEDDDTVTLSDNVTQAVGVDDAKGSETVSTDPDTPKKAG